MSLRAGVLVFPGSNCDRDLAVALRARRGRGQHGLAQGDRPARPASTSSAIPGGFSFGDYLRCGAIAARSPVMRAVVDFAARGGLVLGVCNGFQVLIEAGLLPGALMRNAGLKFVCAAEPLTVATADSAVHPRLRRGETIRLPIAHHDGNYFADPATLARLEGEDRVALPLRRQPQRLGGGDRRHPLGQPPRARADAAPRARRRPAPRRHRRCAAFRRSRRGGRRGALQDA